MLKEQETYPILNQDGTDEQIKCHYDEEGLSYFVGFSNITIAFDYQGYFLSDSNEQYSVSIEAVQHKIFVSLGVESGLLKKLSSPLEASNISCMDLLGDINITESHSDNRSMKGKLIKENEIYMLGLSSLPLDKIGTSTEQCMIIEQTDVPTDTICKPIHAAVTAYIATTGNGTIVDPNILRTSVVKYLSKEIKKGEFTTDSMTYVAFAGMRDPETRPNDSIPTTESIDHIRQKTEKDKRSKNLTALGILIITILSFALVIAVTRKALRSKRAKKKRRNSNLNERDETPGRLVHECELA